MINWIKKKLQLFLDIHMLYNKYDSLNKYCHILEEQFKELRQKNDRVIVSNENFLNQFNSIHTKSNQVLATSQNILDQFNLSADLSPYEHHRNWAIICIKGKPEYVKFIDLAHRDARELQMFIKRFEGTNRVIDTPHSELFYRG